MAGRTAVSRALGSRRLGALVVVAVGVALAVAAVESFFLRSTDGGLVLALVEITLLLAIAYGVAYAGYWLYEADLPDRYVWRVALWSVLGLLGTGAVGVWVLVNQVWQGQAIGNPAVFALATLAAGAAAGVLIGINEVRARSRAAEATRQREDLRVVNQLLRHHILNGTQVIMGLTTTMESDVDEQTRERLGEIRTRSRRLSDLVSGMETLTGSLSGQTDVGPVALPSVLGEELERARRTFPSATVEASLGVPEDTEVRADEALGAVFEHLLRNAVEHNDADSPTVRVEVDRVGDRAVVTVADDGPGIPEAGRSDLFERGSHGNAGLGLYLVDALVTRYGGTVRVEEADLGGTAFLVELPIA